MQGDSSMSATIQPICRSLLAAVILLACVDLTQAGDTSAAKVTKLPPVTDDATPGGATEAKPAALDGLPADKPMDKTAKTDPAGATDSAVHPAAKPKIKKLKRLTPEMTERRDRVRRLLAALRQQPFNTQ